MNFKRLICMIQGHVWEAYTQLISHTLFNRYGQSETRIQPYQQCRRCGRRGPTGPIFDAGTIPPGISIGGPTPDYTKLHVLPIALTEQHIPVVPVTEDNFEEFKTHYAEQVELYKAKNKNIEVAD